MIDEPMVGLDPRSVRMVKDLLRRQVAAGMTVFLMLVARMGKLLDQVAVIGHEQQPLAVLVETPDG